MRRYSMLRAVPLSFFSGDLSRDVATNWRGIGLVYLLMVVVILTIPMLLRLQLAMNLWVKGPGQEFVDQVPTIVIRHRVVQVDRAMPYVIWDRRSGREIAVIDTTGQVASLDGARASVLLTADRLLARKSTVETRQFSLAGINNLSITPLAAKHWLALLSVWALPAIAPFVLGGLFILRLVQVFMFALIGMLVARVVGAALDFSALMRLSVISLTPASILDMVLGFAGHKPTGWGLAWAAVSLVYLAWRVSGNRRPADDTTLPG